MGGSSDALWVDLPFEGGDKDWFSGDGTKNGAFFTGKNKYDAGVAYYHLGSGNWFDHLSIVFPWGGI